MCLVLWRSSKKGFPFTPGKVCSQGLNRKELLALFAKRVYSQFMIEKVKQFMKKNDMVKPGEHVLAGLSGGADSVCLFFLLHLLAGELGFQLSAVHVNHMLRGEKADFDSRFAMDFAKSLNRTCYCVKAPVKQLAEKEGLSVEEAGRKARYDIFLEIAKNTKASVIALAHHKNDQSETMLFHLARGCGIAGLRGIKPVRQWQNETVRMVRPLLCVTRNEIEAFLAKKGIAYVTDETNQSNLYSRNKIRNYLIPFMEKELCEKTVEHMADTAELLLEAEDYLTLMTEQAYQSAVRESCNEQNRKLCSISLDRIKAEHPYMRGSLVKMAMERLAGANKDIEKAHIDSVIRLCEMPVGKKVSLPYHMQAERGYKEIFLSGFYGGAEKTDPAGGEYFSVRIDLPEMGEELELSLKDGTIFHVKAMTYEEFASANCLEKKGEVPDKPYTKWLDCDKIEKCLVLRFREPGDYFYLNDTDTKRVKDYFIHEKIPREKRDSIYLVSQGKHILWITGYRISHYYKITENTKRVLQLTIRGGDAYGRET